MRSKKGYTIIELIITILIISIAMLGVALVFQNVLYRGFRAVAMTTATLLAEEKMDETLRLSYSSVANVASTAFAAPFGNYTYRVVVVNVRPSNLDRAVGSDTGYKNVRVRVTHSNVGTYTLTSLLTDH